MKTPTKPTQPHPIKPQTCFMRFLPAYETPTKPQKTPSIADSRAYETLFGILPFLQIGSGKGRARFAGRTCRCETALAKDAEGFVGETYSCETALVKDSRGFVGDRRQFRRQSVHPPSRSGKGREGVT